jgi:hypothetical protein
VVSLGDDVSGVETLNSEKTLTTKAFAVDKSDFSTGPQGPTVLARALLGKCF